MAPDILADAGRFAHFQALGQPGVRDRRACLHDGGKPHFLGRGLAGRQLRWPIQKGHVLNLDRKARSLEVANDIGWLEPARMDLAHADRFACVIVKVRAFNYSTGKE